MFKTIYRCVYLATIFSISWIFAVLTLIRLGVLVATKGPKKIFASKLRDKEPAPLYDPALGTHGYLHLEEVRIHYVSNGPSEKPLMLLMHGFPESWYSWRFQLKEFSKDYRVVAIDLRGYGESDKPWGISQYKIERMVKDVKQIITALGYSSCVLVGHDWGGAVTWSFTGCYPDMVEKAIVMNCPHPKTFRKYLYMFFFLIPILPEIYIGLSDMKFFDLIFLGRKSGVLTGSVTPEDVEVYKYLFQKWTSLTAPINYIRAGLIFESDRRMVQPATKPLLLMWGCRDNYLETGLAEACKENCHNLTIKYLEKASHWVPMDEPETVNGYMREFLSS